MILNQHGINASGTAPLPAIADNTMRFQFGDVTYNPTTANVGPNGTWTQIDAENNIWDWTSTAADLNQEFQTAFIDLANNPVQIIDCGPFNNLTIAARLFNSCTGLTSCVLNLPICIDLGVAFYNCTNLQHLTIAAPVAQSLYFICTNCEKLNHVPDVHGDINDCRSAFKGCLAAVGAYDLYIALSSQDTPPSQTSACFYNCGSDTPGGAAELAQIPSSWGGTAA